MVLNVWAAWCPQLRRGDAAVRRRACSAPVTGCGSSACTTRRRRSTASGPRSDFGVAFPSVHDDGRRPDRGQGAADHGARRRPSSYAADGTRGRPAPPARITSAGQLDQLVAAVPRCPAVSDTAEDGWFDYLPGWLRPLAVRAQDVRPEQLSRFLPPDEGGRESAVLILFGERRPRLGRRPTCCSSSGRTTCAATPARWPSRAARSTRTTTTTWRRRCARRPRRPGWTPPVSRCSRTLPALFLPPSGFVVTPVLAWWRDPSPVSVVDPRRGRVGAPGAAGRAARPGEPLPRVATPAVTSVAAFDVAGLLVWGFTAGLLDRLLRLAGWEQPWDAADVRELPAGRSTRPCSAGQETPARELARPRAAGRGGVVRLLRLPAGLRRRRARVRRLPRRRRRRAAPRADPGVVARPRPGAVDARGRAGAVRRHGRAGAARLGRLPGAQPDHLATGTGRRRRPRRRSERARDAGGRVVPRVLAAPRAAAVAVPRRSAGRRSSPLSTR